MAGSNPAPPVCFGYQCPLSSTVLARDECGNKGHAHVVNRVGRGACLGGFTSSTALAVNKPGGVW